MFWAYKWMLHPCLPFLPVGPLALHTSQITHFREKKQQHYNFLHTNTPRCIGWVVRQTAFGSSIQSREDSLMENLLFWCMTTLSLMTSVRNGSGECHLHQNRMKCVFLRLLDWRTDFLALAGKISIGCASVKNKNSGRVKQRETEDDSCHYFT